ncbi:lasso peptide isopeptide bond-forming cyclase [Acaryochloris sp. IP29b_bin.148]|uniref:lasso peptide isopeptide bond-forming cyclase n=1 Tax=Acaryochloris sp. IP29b_bin.148 TaxID=2969218 RepID=UPI0026257777|nr:lasso peptide isopeptide bond-forming cyclase [Acaryochloris sp. IP29b_bin.148]
MSAILGIYHRTTPINPEHLGKMLDSLSHRGSDGVGTWYQGSIGLGRRLLWTTPESLHERCPLVSAGGSLILTADARLDNRNQLITDLDLVQHATHELSDGDLILAAYHQWGEACPQHLLGDFAFAIWDESHQSLFCARDHFGVKPFYYYCVSEHFAFATEIKALLTLPHIPKRLNEAKVAEHLANLDSDPTITFYQDILRLPPGHSLTIHTSGVTLQSYWQLDANIPELQLKSTEDYTHQFLEHFTAAVQCRLRSAFPVGSMLSGGLDSSSITCLARQILDTSERSQETLHTFSARFDRVSACDERSYQDAVLTTGRYTPHLLWGDQLGPFASYDKAVWHRDAAIMAGNFRLNWGLYEIAQQKNVRVILDGWDGDSTVSHGNEYLRELARSGRWFTLARETQAYGKRYNLPWQKVLLKWFWRYGLRSAVASLIKTRPTSTPVADSPQPNAIHPDLPLSPQFVGRTGLDHKLQTLQLPPPQTERESHYRCMMANIHSSMLELLDTAGGAFSIDLRFPFFDKRLVEFCLSLPPDQKLHQGWGRFVLRNAIGGIVPSNLQWRLDKTNMQPGFEFTFKTYEQSAIQSVLFNHPETIDQYIDILALRDIYQRWMQDQAFTAAEVNTLWRSVSLGMWLHQTRLTF